MGRVSDYWSGHQHNTPHWYSFCIGEINRRITGNSEFPPSKWAIEKYGGPLPTEHLLEIGCLSGDKLAATIDAGLARRCSGVDIAAGAIARGKEKWGDKLELSIVDLNEPVLPKESYSIIMSTGVLHHIQNLEICVQALYDSLKPGGILLASEFTGPCRYAYSDKETRHIREGQEMLPEVLRGPLFDRDQLVPKLNIDPSEAIRTRDIGLVIRATFDRVMEWPYGGNVLMRALTPNFFQSFDPTDPEHTLAIEQLVKFDERISQQEPSHHAYFVAWKGPLSPE